MGFGFHKSIQLLPGIRVHLSKSGASLSLGRPGATVNVGGRGVRTTVGAPGTGISYTTQRSWGGRRGRSGGAPPRDSAAARRTPQQAPRIELPAPRVRPATPEEDALVKGWQMLHEGNEAGALEELNRAVPLADGAYLAGVLALKHGLHMQAAGYLSYALEKQAELGQHFRKFGVDASVSLPVTEELTAVIGPDSEGVMLALCEAYQALNRTAEAAQTLRGLVASRPDDVLVRLSLAELVMDTWGSDRAACEEVLRLSEGVDNDTEWHAALLLYRARALMAMGVHEGARSLLTAALRKTSGRSVELLCALRYERALANEALNRTADARADLERVFAANPAYEDVAKRLARG